MIEIITLCYVIIAGTYLLVLTRGRWLLNPAPLWVLAQLVFLSGTIPLIDASIRADVVYLFAMLGGLCFFILGALIVDLGSPHSRAEAKRWLSAPLCRIESGTRFNFLLWVIIALSVAISSAYYRAVGYNLFLEGIVSHLRGDGGLTNVSMLRLYAYSTGPYFAPGYVNQFKNVLLPVLVGYLCARYVLSWQRRRIDLIAIGTLVPLSLLFLLGTGQRAAFVYAALIILVFFMAVLPPKTARRARVVIMVSSVAIFSMSTLILGRGGLTQIQSTSDIGSLIAQLARRIFLDNQLSGVYGFRYVYVRPVQFGAEWVGSFKDLLPGQGGVRIANEVFAAMYGSLLGTAPLSIWGSLWYNFGVLGVTVFPWLLGMLYQGTYLKLVRGPKTLFRLLMYSATYVLLGMWIASGPDGLVEDGVVTIVILRIGMGFWLRMNDRVIPRSVNQVKKVKFASE